MIRDPGDVATGDMYVFCAWCPYEGVVEVWQESRWVWRWVCPTCHGFGVEDLSGDVEPDDGLEP